MDKLNAYADSQAPSAPHTEEEQLVFKIADETGAVIGGCILHVHAWGRAVLATLWVDEPYRRQGLGFLLPGAADGRRKRKTWIREKTHEIRLSI